MGPNRRGRSLWSLIISGVTGPLFPSNASRVWVQGTFIDLTGNAMSGQVTFTPSPTLLLDQAPKLIISGKVFAAQLDLNGHFQVQVPCTDDPDITPTDWTYKVVEPTGRSYNIVVPQGTPTLNQQGHPLNGQRVIDLIDVVPAPSPQAGTVQLLSGRGVSGLSIDGQGHLIATYTDNTVQDVGVMGSTAALLAANARISVLESLVGTLSAELRLPLARRALVARYFGVSQPRTNRSLGFANQGVL